MRTEIELKMIAQGIFGITFPVDRADFVSLYKARAKIEHPDTGGDGEAFKLTSQIYQEIITQSNNATFFNEGTTIAQIETSQPVEDEHILCWNCGSRGEITEKLKNHRTGQWEISKRYKCDVCNGKGELLRANNERNFNKHSKAVPANSMAGGGPSGFGHVPDHVQ